VNLSVVMAGLVPAIHALLPDAQKKDVDARHKAGHDGGQYVARTERQRRPGQTSPPAPDFASLNPGYGLMLAILKRQSIRLTRRTRDCTLRIRCLFPTLEGDVSCG